MREYKVTVEVSTVRNEIFVPGGRVIASFSVITENPVSTFNAIWEQVQPKDNNAERADVQ